MSVSWLHCVVVVVGVLRARFRDDVEAQRAAQLSTTDASFLLQELYNEIVAGRWQDLALRLCRGMGRGCLYRMIKWSF